MSQMAKNFLPLSPKDFHILFALAAEPLHGYAIVNEIERRTDGRIRVEPANLYRRIHQFVEQRLLEEVAPPADQAGIDKRRRYYRTTSLGMEVLKAETALMRNVLAEAATIGLVLGPGGTE